MRSRPITLILLLLAFACGAPKPTTFTLTVTKAGTGAGVIAGTGISCGTDCSETYDSGSAVTLAATADTGSTLTGFTGCDSASGNSCQLTMTADRTVTATFGTMPVTRIDADITTPTTWAGGAIYRVTKRVTVTAALTVQPGAVVQFDPGAGLTVTGTLTVNGQAADTAVVFTSTAGTGPGGAWEGIELRADGSTLDYCAVLYAGQNDEPALKIADGFSATIRNCTFAHHRSPDATIEGAAALHAAGAGAATIIESNRFYDDRVPLVVNATFSVKPNAFDNAVAAPSEPQPNVFNAIFVRGCSHVATAITWPALAVPYVIGSSVGACNYVVIDAAGRLTVGTAAEPAVVKFFAGGQLTAGGVLTATATFTSIKDDTRGGDTNGDGAASSPAGGDWDGINLTKAGSALTASGLYYTGAEDNSAVAIATGIAATITDTRFGHHRPPTTTVRSAPALDASDAAGASVIARNTFYDAIVPLAMNTTLSIDDTNNFTGSDPGSTTALLNKYQAVLVRGCGHVATDVVWAVTKVPVLIGDPTSACNYVVVDSAGHLTLADTVVVKFFPGGSLETSGVVTADATIGIAFTSYSDDAHGGDTNADGAATAPAGGQWDGLWVRANGSVFDHVQLLYAGGAATGGSASALMVASSRSVVVTSSVIAHAHTADQTLRAPAALDVSDAAPAGTVVQNNRFFDNTVPLAINANLSLDDSNLFDSGLPGEQGRNVFNGVMVAGCGHVTASTQWLVAKAPLVIGDPVNACNYLVVDGAAHLTVGPATTMKFFANGSLTVNNGGLLTVDATSWLTSIRDDHMNDTNADGSATTPAVGDWHGVKYIHSGSNPTCDQAAYMHYNTPNAGNECAW